MNYPVRENAGEVVITIEGIGGSSGAVSVDYATSNGSAIAPGDYTARSGTLTWAAGDVSTKTFTIPISNDAQLENNEIVNLTLSNPTGGAALQRLSE